MLLQLVSEKQPGPGFFEFIQCKGNQAIRRGQLKTPIESLEVDQMRRGVCEDGRRPDAPGHRERS